MTSMMIGSALATLLSVAAHAEAGMIASSFLNEDGGGRQIHCNISNVGTREIIVLSARIVDGVGNDMPLGTTCYGTIPAGRGCALIAYGDVGIYGRGVIEVQGSTKSLRGRCAILAPGLSAAAESEMR